MSLLPPSSPATNLVCHVPAWLLAAPVPCMTQYGQHHGTELHKLFALLCCFFLSEVREVNA